MATIFRNPAGGHPAPEHMIRRTILNLGAVLCLGAMLTALSAQAETVPGTKTARRAIAKPVIPPTTAGPATTTVTTLSQALSAAYRFSPDLRAARHQLDVVNESRPQALSQWLPTVTIGGVVSQTATRTPGLPLANTTGYGPTATAVLPLTHGGGEYAKLHAADHLILAQRALLLATEQVILGQAAQAYMDVALYSALVKYRSDSLSALRQVVQSINRQMKIGDRTATDLSLAQARTADAEALLEQARGSLATANAAYRQAIGEDPGRLSMPAPLTMIPPDLQATTRLAEDSSPNVVAARFQLLAARDQAEVQLAQLLPSLSLQFSDQGLFERTPRYPIAYNGLNAVATAELVLTVPLYQGGAEYAAVRVARKTALERKEQLESARNQAIGGATQAWRQREATEATRLDFAKSVSANERLVAQDQIQLDAGQLTTLEVLISLQDLVNAQINQMTAEHDRRLADFAVLNSVGGLTARTLELPVNYYDPEGDYARTKWRIFGLSVDQ